MEGLISILIFRAIPLKSVTENTFSKCYNFGGGKIESNLWTTFKTKVGGKNRQTI